MKRFRVVLGMLAMVLVLGLAFIGCATDSGASAETAVANLVRALGGTSKATANGSTVTLISGVRLENATLIVPAGVTLDLTSETLQLADNAVLTVNGTVNARGHVENGHAESIFLDGTVTINGSGTINLQGKGSLLWILNGRTLTLDGVTLVGVEDNNQPLVVTKNNGELILLSGAIMGNNNAKDDGWWPGGGVNVGGQGTFTMSGGEISGNGATGTGGGVGVQGTFIMSGGTISGNRDTGIVVFEGTFTMSGGVISGNSGGVGLNNQSTFTMEGGTIYGSSEGTNANTASALGIREGRGNTAKWGTGGTYTKGGVPQVGGSDIGESNDTLIAIPAQ